MISYEFITIYNFTSVQFHYYYDYHYKCSDSKHNRHKYNNPVWCSHTIGFHVTEFNTSKFSTAPVSAF